MKFLSTTASILLLLAGCNRVPDADGDGHDAYTDCDDDNDQVNPDAAEICDGIDNNCSGGIDDNATDALTLYADSDGDGYGNPDAVQSGCAASAGWVEVADDCDDSNASINPGVVEEVCTDPIDYNCDGSSGYDDADGDGFAACKDCNDASAADNPAGIEICDGSDNDCDGATDEDAIDQTVWYMDNDADGFGSEAVKACDAPEGAVEADGDCDDDNDQANPEAAEVCDGADNDCDGDADENAVDATAWYADIDGDGHGGPVTTDSCTAIPGYLETSDDCNDSNPTAYPGADEVCDGVDNDCDGSADNNPIDLKTFYADVDADGYGTDSDSVEACTAPSGYVDRGGDCNDALASVRPGLTEQCDGLDNDCAGGVDNGLAQSTFYLDADGDGFGVTGLTTSACAAPPSYTDLDGDCDDDESAVSPSELEDCTDGVDNDCDSAQDCDDWDDCKNDSELTCWDCGDGFQDPDEQCDDGNNDDDDGCSATCEAEWIDSYTGGGQTIYRFAARPLPSSPSNLAEWYQAICEDAGLKPVMCDYNYYGGPGGGYDAREYNAVILGRDHYSCNVSGGVTNRTGWQNVITFHVPRSDNRGLCERGCTITGNDVYPVCTDAP